MAEDRTPFTARQDEFSCERLEECGLKPGGWPKQAARAKDAKVNDTTDLSLYLFYSWQLLSFGCDRLASRRPDLKPSQLAWFVVFRSVISEIDVSIWACLHYPK